MKSFFTLIFSFSFILCYADNTPITGNLHVPPGSTQTYTANWDGWDYLYENYANVTWTVTRGAILSSDKHTVTILWDEVPTWLNEIGTIEVYEDLGGQSGNREIELQNYLLGTSETCTGVLGPFAIAEDFGHGNNPGLPLQVGTTTYSYQPFCAIEHDEYTVLTNTQSCRSGWHQIPQDHTPNDVDGYFLLFDGSSSKGECYRRIVSGLTTSFKYQFSAWVGNIGLPPGLPDPSFTPPRLKFEIRDLNNNLLGTSATIEMPFSNTFQWQEISFMFDIPLNVNDISVIIVNENGGDLGNDFVIDDIAFAPCYPPIIASFSPNPTILDKSKTCNSGIINFYSWWPTSVIPYNNPGYQWQKSTDGGNVWINIIGANTLTYTHSETSPGVYKYRIKTYETSNPSQFVVSNSITFFVQSLTVNAKTYKVLGCASLATELNPTVNLNFSDPSEPPHTFTYSWSPGTYLSNTNISNPTITLPTLPPLFPPNPPNPVPPINYSYNLTVQDITSGCSGVNTQTVAQYNPRKVYCFTGFNLASPTNNTFYPVNIWDYNDFGAEFWIFNRWGQLIHYRNHGTTKADWEWDGRINGIRQPTNQYVFMVKIPVCPTNFGTPLLSGVSYNSSTGVLSGTCYLIY
jgi:hypothetical protein